MLITEFIADRIYFSTLLTKSNKRDKNHSKSKNLVRNLLKGEYGNRFTISEVFNEVSTILFRQTKNIEIVKNAWNAIYEKEIA